MTKEFDYKTRGVCSRMIHVTVEDDIVTDVRFFGGCNGNTQGVASLVKGMPVQEVIKRLDGIDCGGRGTSCPAQLANALKENI
ncbi:MAG: TIGR03905 family TSCPD domain-containing protein [Clostridia bacterium]|nr:TIGR03905 family TSCPD domain-containing protein [Clostridia bacterium]